MSAARGTSRTTSRPGLPSVNAIAAVVALLGYAAAMVAFFLQRDGLVIDPSWVPQFTIVLVVGVVMAMVVSSNRRLVAPAYLLELGLVLLAGYPLGENIVIEMMLGIALVSQSALIFARPWHLVTSIGSLALLIVAQSGGSAWGVEYAAPAPAMLVLFALSPSTALGLSLVIRRVTDMYRTERIYAERLDEAVENLMDANIAFQQYAQSIGEESTQSERRRISREIHDSVGYTLVNLTMMMEAAMDLVEPGNDALLALLRGAREQAGDGLQDTRRAVRSLRSIPDEHAVGLQALQRLVRAFSAATGVEVRMGYANMPMTLGQELDRAIYRIVQEGLTNAFRHGRATMIQIDLSVQDGSAHVVIADNGTGSDAVHEGVGFVGMRERVERLGGTLSFGNLAGGFQVQAHLPIEVRTDHGEDQSSTGG